MQQTFDERCTEGGVSDGRFADNYVAGSLRELQVMLHYNCSPRPEIIHVALGNRGFVMVC